jgi:hypothetical protein
MEVGELFNKPHQRAAAGMFFCEVVACRSLLLFLHSGQTPQAIQPGLMSALVRGLIVPATYVCMTTGHQVCPGFCPCWRVQAGHCHTRGH